MRVEAGPGRGRRAAGALLALALGLAAARAGAEETDLIAPRAGQTDWELGYSLGLVTDNSVVQVRENAVAGATLRYSDLGLTLAQTPELGLAHWLTERDAVMVGGRWSFLRGDAFVPTPFDFNGATVASGQSVTTTADAYTLSARYVRRLVSDDEGGWDVRGRLGLDYTHLNFVIDGGHAPVTGTSQGTETKENVFSIAELPVPVVGVEAWGRVGPRLLAVVSAEGSWINHWDTLRREGGEMFLSQTQLEFHGRLVDDDSDFGGWRPWIGWFYRYYMENQTSNEDGNYARAESSGPEIGFVYSF